MQDRLTTRHTSAFPRRDSPGVCQEFPPSPNRGRRECRAPGAPAAARAMVASKEAHALVRSHRKHPAFPAQWFYDLFRALPGDRAFLPPSPLRSLLLKNLTPASRRQDHTTSPSASRALVRSALRVHRIPSRVRDDRDTPLEWDGMTGIYQ